MFCFIHMCSLLEIGSRMVNVCNDFSSVCVLHKVLQLVLCHKESLKCEIAAASPWLCH